jgi:DNA-binding SARP family transcriptional activator/DNA-binding beta-propeller fold protein YncE
VTIRVEDDVTHEFRVLGPVEALVDSVRLELGGPKQRAVLALLLLRANELVLRERLIDELWGDAPPPTARETLKVYAGRLRKVLNGDGPSPRLVTHGGGYLLELDPDQVDVHRFLQLAERGSHTLGRGDAEAAAALLREALALWRGPPLADLGDAPFVRAERGRLEELRLTALEERIEADLAGGRAAAVVPELQQLTREHPYRERLHRQLMLALYRTGRQADALEAYRDLRGRLSTDLGLEPSPDSRDLERAILASDRALASPPIGPRTSETTATPQPELSPASGPLYRRPLPLAAAAVLVLVALGALVSVLVLGGGGPGGLSEVNPNHVGVIDPKTNRIVDEIQVGLRPDSIAVGKGAVWVGNLEDKTLSRIDLKTNEVRTITLGNRTPTDIAMGGRAVWVALGREGSVARIDPRYEVVSKPIPVAAPSQYGSVVFGGGSLWAAFGDSTVARIDPRAERLVARSWAFNADAIAYGAEVNALWVANDHGEVWRFSPSSFAGGPVQRQPLVSFGNESAPTAVSAFGQFAWAANPGASVVSKIKDGGGPTTFPTAGRPVAVAAGPGAVWVATQAGTVLRLDPASGKVVATIRTGNLPSDLAIGGGRVWVTIQQR